MSKETGGPAFPKAFNCGEDGVTLRDYFAAKALNGFLAAHAGADVAMPPHDYAAMSAYKYADAMIAERSK